MRLQRVRREKARACRTPSDTVVDAPPPPRHSPRDPKLAPTSPARPTVIRVLANATIQGFSGPQDVVRITRPYRQRGRSNMRRPAPSPAVSQGRLRTTGRRTVQPHGFAHSEAPLQHAAAFPQEPAENKLHGCASSSLTLSLLSRAARSRSLLRRCRPVVRVFAVSPCPLPMPLNHFQNRRSMPSKGVIHDLQRCIRFRNEHQHVRILRGHRLNRRILGLTSGCRIAITLGLSTTASVRVLATEHAIADVSMSQRPQACGVLDVVDQAVVDCHVFPVLSDQLAGHIAVEKSCFT